MMLEKRCLSLYVLLVIFAMLPCNVMFLNAASAQPFPEEFSWMQKEFQGKWAQFQKAVSLEPQMIDVQKYDVYIQFSPLTYSITGIVTIDAKAEEDLDTVMIDMHDELIIDSLTVDGEDKDYLHEEGKIVLSFSSPLQANSSFTVTVAYHAAIQPDQPRGLIFTVHGDLDIPVISTLSEPYLAPSWWPCIDNPDDKALVELYLTCPSEVKGEPIRAFSNGILVASTVNDDETTTFHWSVKNPIPTYLICVAISNYMDMDSLNDTYTSRDGETEMPLDFYCYPEHLEQAEFVFEQVKEEIELFSDLFGEYPFLDEKHAIIEIPMESSGMEHQTITCMQDEHVGDAEAVSRVTVGHEVAHQWFGDAVTMKTWNDIWLNEGFATFFQMYYREAFGEIDATIDKLKIFGTGLFGESYQNPVYVRDVSDPFKNTGAVYFKGSWVLHMLREMMDDDEAFFAVLKSYFQKYKYGNATTADLRVEFEAGWGASLEYYFDQWVYTPAWPVYGYEMSDATLASDGKYQFDVQVFQKQQHSVVDISENVKRDFYIMPVDLTIKLEDDTEQTFTLLNNHRNQRFQLKTDSPPVSVEIDKDLNILRDVDAKASVPSDNILPVARHFSFPIGKGVPLRVLLFGSASDDDGTIAKYTWVIDNRQILKGRFAIATLQEIGNHQIFLTVEDDKGGAGSSVPVVIEVK